MLLQVLDRFFEPIHLLLQFADPLGLLLHLRFVSVLALPTCPSTPESITASCRGAQGLPMLKAFRSVAAKSSRRLPLHLAVALLRCGGSLLFC